MSKPTNIFPKSALAIIFWLMPLLCFSQTVPIFVVPTLTPPYSLVLSDYAKPGAQNLVVTLMVNDATITNLPVRLHLRIETITGIVIENIPTMNARPIYLNGGQALMLFGSDLADNFNINNLQFRGISREDYRRTGQIPAGFYRFTVEVRHFATGRLISNQGNIRAWMALGRPPELRNPANEAEMGQIPGAPLVFSWQPAQLGIPGGNIRYLFEMWEMRVPNISPYVYAASMPVFHSQTTSATALNIPPASLFLEPGMQYAWRVTAFDPSGFIPFIENGHSEVRTFVYQSRCEEITNLTINRTGRNVAIRWRGAPNHTSFFMEVENPNSDYRNRIQLFDSRYDLFNVEEGKTYNIRIQAVCGGNENNMSDFTAWHTFTIPERQTTETHCPECACDAQFENVQTTNFERREVEPGDTIRLADNSTRFIIKTAEQQPNGAQRGVFLFWWEYYGIKVLCEYWDLTVNTDNVILTYDFESIYNPQFLFDVDEIRNYIDSISNAIAGGFRNPGTEIQDSINVDGVITEIYIDENGNVVVVTIHHDGSRTEEIRNDIDGGGVAGSGGGDNEDETTNLSQLGMTNNTDTLSYYFIINNEKIANGRTLYVCQNPRPITISIVKQDSLGITKKSATWSYNNKTLTEYSIAVSIDRLGVIQINAEIDTTTNLSLRLNVYKAPAVRFDVVGFDGSFGFDKYIGQYTPHRDTPEQEDHQIMFNDRDKIYVPNISFLPNQPNVNITATFTNYEDLQKDVLLNNIKIYSANRMVKLNHVDTLIINKSQINRPININISTNNDTFGLRYDSVLVVTSCGRTIGKLNVFSQAPVEKRLLLIHIQTDSLGPAANFSTHISAITTQLNRESFNQAFIQWNIVDTIAIFYDSIRNNERLREQNRLLVENSNNLIHPRDIFIPARNIATRSGVVIEFDVYVGFIVNNVIRTPYDSNGFANYFDGIVYYWGRRYFMMSEDNYNGKLIAHELGHCLRLHHPYGREDEKIINETILRYAPRNSTDNVMDADKNRMHTFWLWQWIIMNSNIRYYKQ